jgi:hypothetical protein
MKLLIIHCLSLVQLSLSLSLSLSAPCSTSPTAFGLPLMWHNQCVNSCKWGVEVKLDAFLTLTCQWIALWCHCFLSVGKISCYLYMMRRWMVPSSKWTTSSTTIICVSIGLHCWCLKYRL